MEYRRVSGRVKEGATDEGDSTAEERERKRAEMILSALPDCLPVRSNEEIIYPSFMSGALRVFLR